MTAKSSHLTLFERIGTVFRVTSLPLPKGHNKLFTKLN